MNNSRGDPYIYRYLVLINGGLGPMIRVGIGRARAYDSGRDREG